MSVIVGVALYALGASVTALILGGMIGRKGEYNGTAGLVVMLMSIIWPVTLPGTGLVRLADKAAEREERRSGE